MADIIRDLDIDALVHGGRGIGHHDGKAVFVPLTMPGDQVSCKVVKSRRRFCEAELLEVLTPSELRHDPPCPFFGDCGGCQWQHLPYSEQVSWKEKIFTDFLTRGGLTDVATVMPIAVAPEQWHYRNRVQFKCHYHEGRLKIGFYRHASHYVVDVDHCMLLAQPLQQALTLLRSELPKSTALAALTQIDAACGDDGAVRLVFRYTSHKQLSPESWLRSFARRHSIAVCIQTSPDGRPSLVEGVSDLLITVDHPELKLRYGPGCFAQVNPAQNRAMVNTAVELLDLQGTEQILDLFCGMGNFSLPMARRAARVVGVEAFAASIASARINAEVNSVTNVEFKSADVTKLLPRLAREDRFDLIVLDPPRSGSFKAARALLAIRPQRILYVSCDPATLVRDLAPLVAEGYHVVSSQPFDLFPQSWHCESVTLLQDMKFKQNAEG